MNIKYVFFFTLLSKIGKKKEQEIEISDILGGIIELFELHLKIALLYKCIFIGSLRKLEGRFRNLCIFRRSSENDKESLLAFLLMTVALF